MNKNYDQLSKYLCFILRHKPEEIGQPREVIDEHGFMEVDTLINSVNKKGKYELSREILEEIVSSDIKGRYRFSDDGKKIKCCQGHSIEWVIPELEYKEPPEYLYHGTTAQALQKIMSSGHISKMRRHAVHMQADIEKAEQSARRWHLTPVVLKIAARKLSRCGTRFGVTENEVWCAEDIPAEFIEECIYIKE